MRITLRTWLYVAIVTVLGLGYARAHECGEVVAAPNELDPTKVEDFPMEAFEKRIDRSDRGGRDWVIAAEEHVKAILLEEVEKQTVGEYPTCYYQPACPSEAIIAQYWYVKGSSKECWLAQPVIWIRCLTHEPSYECDARGDGAVGRSCRQSYTPQTVLVFCDKGDDLKFMTIPIATGCIASTNWCVTPA